MKRFLFMITPFLKLPFHFSEEKLLNDLEVCKNLDFISHFNKNDYSGEWTSIALRSQNGEMNNIFALSQGSENYKNTELIDKCVYFKEIINLFECEKESIRLLNLKPGSVIKEHTDYNLGYEDGIFRIHIAITTNKDVHFFINSEEVKMLPGESWYGNFNLPHSVRNDGKTDRIHLVMDCIRNNWSDNLFEECGYSFDVEKEQPEYSRETKLQIIEQLKLMDTETAREMVSQLNKELQ